MTAAFRITGGKDRNVIRRFQIGKKVRRTVKFLSVRDYLLSIYCMYSCKLTDFFFINSSVLLFHIWNIFAISRRYKSYLGHNSQIDSNFPFAALLLGRERGIYLNFLPAVRCPWVAALQARALSLA